MVKAIISRFHCSEMGGIDHPHFKCHSGSREKGMINQQQPDTQKPKHVMFSCKLNRQLVETACSAHAWVISNGACHVYSWDHQTINDDMNWYDIYIYTYTYIHIYLYIYKYTYLFITYIHTYIHDHTCACTLYIVHHAWYIVHTYSTFNIACVCIHVLWLHD